MPPSVRQTSFAAGELSPLLWGRTDLAIFGKGLRRCRNFFLSKQGAAVSRPGTSLIALSKSVFLDGSGAVVPGISDAVRLIPFIAGDDESYVLVFGQNYVRFLFQGAEVLQAPGGAPYEVPTPYTVADLPLLKYAQTGDVLTLVHPNHDARELRIIAANNWQLTTIDFTPFSPYFVDPDTGNPTTGFSVVDSGTNDSTTTPPGIVDPDTDHPAREWQWQVTALVKDRTTGAVYETLPELVSEQFSGGDHGTATDYDHTARALEHDTWAIYPDRPITLRRQETDGLISQPDGWNTYDVIAYNVYRGRGNLFGFIGQTTSRDFVDVGDSPDYATQPPIGTQPFGTATEADPSDPALGTRRKDRPVTVGFFQERRVFAGSVLQPDTVFASKTGDYFNFDARVLIHVSGEALTFTLAARKREEIRGVLMRQRALLFTSVGVWSAGGSQGSPMDFDDIDARLEDETGATHLQPIVSDGVVLYARSKGVGVRALIADGQQYSYKGVDLSAQAQHLFLGASNNLVDWCFAQDPWGVVWAVRADGQLLSLSSDGETWGWARHDTDGLVESVCSVPEGDEDAVYLVVRRTANGATSRFIERMESRVTRYPLKDADGNPNPPPNWDAIEYPDSLCVDAAIEYVGDPTTDFNGLDALNGKDVYVIARGLDPVGPLTVVGGTLADVYDEAPPTNYVNAAGKAIFVAHIGLLFTPEIESLDVAAGDARMRKKTVERIGFEVDNSVGIAVGQDLQHLDEWVQRDVDDGFAGVSMATELVDMPVESTIDQSARVALRQTAPLPVTVVGITRELSLGE